MKSADALAELERHQSLIRAEIALATEVAERKPVSWHDTLAQSRWRMFRLLRAYQLFKHNEVYGPILRSSHPGRAEQARALKASCIATGERYELYTSRWPADAMVRDVDGYRHALREQVAGLQQQMVEERRIVALLLAEVSRTRMS